MTVVAWASVFYGVSRQATRHIQHTRAGCQCPLRGTYFALKSVSMNPAWMSFTLLLYAGDSLGLPTVFLVRTKFITMGSFAIFPLFYVSAVVDVVSFLHITISCLLM